MSISLAKTLTHLVFQIVCQPIDRFLHNATHNQVMCFTNSVKNISVGKSYRPAEVGFNLPCSAIVQEVSVNKVFELIAYQFFAIWIVDVSLYKWGKTGQIAIRLR